MYSKFWEAHRINRSTECQMLWVSLVSMKASRPLCDRKLSKAGVSLLRPEPRLRGAADSVLHSVRTLPCHVIRYMQSLCLQTLLQVISDLLIVPHHWGTNSVLGILFHLVSLILLISLLCLSVIICLSPVLSSPTHLGGGCCTLALWVYCRKPWDPCCSKARLN